MRKEWLLPHNRDGRKTRRYPFSYSIAMGFTPIAVAGPSYILRSPAVVGVVTNNRHANPTSTRIVGDNTNNGEEVFYNRYLRPS